SGTSSIHLPDASVAYVRGLFAFQSAFVSVVSVKQPTETSFRTAQGRTVRAQAPTQSAGPAHARVCQARKTAITSGRKTRRVLARIASPRARPVSAASESPRPDL